MTFSVYGPQNEFTNALVTEFGKLAKTALATTIEELQTQNAANIIAVTPFHDNVPMSFGKKVLRVVRTDTHDKLQNNGTYYVVGRVNIREAAQIVVKRFVGFESSKSCVICPSSMVIDTPLAVFTVPLELSSEPSLKKVITVSSKPKELKEIKKQKFAVRVPRKKLSLSLPRYNVRRSLIFLLIFIIWFFSLPYVLLIVSGACSYTAFKTLPNRNSVMTSPLLRCGQVSALGANTLLNFSPLKSSGNLPQFMYDASQLALEASSIYKGLPTLTIDALTAVTPDLYKLSRDIAILSSRTDEIAQISSLSRELPFFLHHSSLFQVLAAAASQSPDLLGKQEPKTYLVLLQNNMELRPTGGFIGSFLLVDVDNGEVTAQKIYDVYDADGQLTGFVKPPEAIVNYLGEASWHLRDSNWDPDFEISAKRAVWFLDKSLNRKVDGVIGVDLEVLRTLIQQLGSIEVPDYGGTLTADNFYSTIQSEVHKEFFPGSRKKSNYLTAVFNAVLSKLNKEGSRNTISLLTGIIKNLDSRDIQFYSTNDVLQSEFNKAGIAGAVSVNSLGFVEANVGVNKANQYIERAGSWKLEKEGSGTIAVTGKLEFTNTAQSASDETRYRVYLRTFAPKGSVLESLRINVGGVMQAIVPEKETLPQREQEGAFFELKAGEKALVTVSWSCPPATDISLWKQGGVLPYPISVSVLTGGPSRQYNTTFGQDEHIEL